MASESLLIVERGPPLGGRALLLWLAGLIASIVIVAAGALTFVVNQRDDGHEERIAVGAGFGIVVRPWGTPHDAVTIPSSELRAFDDDRSDEVVLIRVRPWGDDEVVIPTRTDEIRAAVLERVAGMGLPRAT